MAKSYTRLPEIPACTHVSHTFKNSLGTDTATKSRFAGSFPIRPHAICQMPDGQRNSRNACSTSGFASDPTLN